MAKRGRPPGTKLPQWECPDCGKIWRGLACCPYCRNDWVIMRQLGQVGCPAEVLKRSSDG